MEYLVSVLMVFVFWSGTLTVWWIGMNVSKKIAASILVSKRGDKYKYYNFVKPSDDVCLETLTKTWTLYPYELLQGYKCMETP
jgi:hypothetical protein